MAKMAQGSGDLGALFRIAGIETSEPTGATGTYKILVPERKSPPPEPKRARTREHQPTPRPTSRATINPLTDAKLPAAAPLASSPLPTAAHNPGRIERFLNYSSKPIGFNYKEWRSGLERCLRGLTYANVIELLDSAQDASRTGEGQFIHRYFSVPRQVFEHLRVTQINNALDLPNLHDNIAARLNHAATKTPAMECYASFLLDWLKYLEPILPKGKITADLALPFVTTHPATMATENAIELLQITLRILPPTEWKKYLNTVENCLRPPIPDNFPHHQAVRRALYCFANLIPLTVQKNTEIFRYMWGILVNDLLQRPAVPITKAEERASLIHHSICEISRANSSSIDIIPEDLRTALKTAIETSDWDLSARFLNASNGGNSLLRHLANLLGIQIEPTD